MKQEFDVEPSQHTCPKIYIAGPMTGHPELNFPAFHAAAADYRARGAFVINPAEINADPTAEWADCMRADIAALVTCDTIVLLDGYEKSKGATLELTIAQALGMTVVWPEIRVGPHRVYTDRDLDRPDVICDSNGATVLALCKDCGRGECELDEPCVPRVAP